MDEPLEHYRCRDYNNNSKLLNLQKHQSFFSFFNVYLNIYLISIIKFTHTFTILFCELLTHFPSHSLIHKIWEKHHYTTLWHFDSITRKKWQRPYALLVTTVNPIITTTTTSEMHYMSHTHKLFKNKITSLFFIL